MIRIDIDDREVKQALEKLQRRVGDMTPAMRDIGEVLTQSTAPRHRRLAARCSRPSSAGVGRGCVCWPRRSSTRRRSGSSGNGLLPRSGWTQERQWRFAVIISHGGMRPIAISRGFRCSGGHPSAGGPVSPRLRRNLKTKSTSTCRALAAGGGQNETPGAPPHTGLRRGRVGGPGGGFSPDRLSRIAHDPHRH